VNARSVPEADETALPEGKPNGKSDLLTQMQEVTGLHRKSLPRLLHAPTLERQKRSRRRGRTYGQATLQVILVVWKSLDCVCAERLTPVLLSTAQHLARFGSVHLTSEVEEQLAQISEATVTRLLRTHRSRKKAQNEPAKFASQFR
jgi:hypothetical protein